MKGSSSLLHRLSKVCGNPDANLSHFEGGRGHFYLVFLRFVETLMQHYHTLKGSRSLLPSLFEVCGNPDATLSHFEGVKLTFTCPKPITATKNTITATKNTITAAKKQITAAKNQITAAKKPITAAKNPTTAAIILYRSFK